MSIDTTLYVHKSNLGLIDKAAALTGYRRSQIIVMLLKRVMRDFRKTPQTGSVIRYQGRDRKDKWHTVHVRFREDEADYFRDLRNFYKLSDSLILAQAVRDYLDEIIGNSERGVRSDNYPFANYIISRDVVDGLIFWNICWGFPQYPLKYFRM